MARVTLQQFAAAIDNISIDALAHQGTTLALGRWTAGAATGELNFEGVPSFTAPSKATERQRKDYKNASVLLGLKPRYAFDDFLTGRQELVDFLNEQHRLELLGYTGESVRMALSEWATKKTDSRTDPTDLVLGKAVSRLYGYLTEAAATYFKLSRDFGAFNETEAQAAAYDLALVDNFKKMDPHERAAWLSVMARPDGTVDKRTLIALFRVPPVLTGLSDQELSNIGAAYFRSEWPQTAQAMVVLNRCVGPAHDSLRSAIKTITPWIGKKTNELPTVTDESAEWLDSDFDHSYSFEPPTSE